MPDFTNLEAIETTQGISRALVYTRKFLGEAAKRKMPVDEIAAELKRREDMHDAWEQEASKYRQLTAWFRQMKKEEQESVAGKLAAEAIERLGQWLWRTRVVGH